MVGSHDDNPLLNNNATCWLVGHVGSQSALFGPNRWMKLSPTNFTEAVRSLPIEIVKYSWPSHFLPFYLATWLYGFKWSPTYTSSVAVLSTTICQAAHRNLLSLSWFHHPQEGWSMLQQQLCCRCPHPVLPMAHGFSMMGIHPGLPCSSSSWNWP